MTKKVKTEIFFNNKKRSRDHLARFLKIDSEFSGAVKFWLDYIYNKVITKNDSYFENFNYVKLDFYFKSKELSARLYTPDGSFKNFFFSVRNNEITLDAAGRLKNFKRLKLDPRIMKRKLSPLKNLGD